MNKLTAIQAAAITAVIALGSAASASPTLSTLATFEGTNGAFPYFNDLIADSSNDLIGTTQEGGTYNDGTVFELAAGSRELLPKVVDGRDRSSGFFHSVHELDPSDHVGE